MSTEDEFDPRVLRAIEECKAYCVEHAPGAGCAEDLAVVLGQSGDLHPTLLLHWWTDLCVLVDEPAESPERAAARTRFDRITEVVTSKCGDRSWLVIEAMVRATSESVMNTELTRRRAVDKCKGNRESLDDRYGVCGLMREHLDLRGNERATVATFKMSPVGKKLLSELRANKQSISDRTLGRYLKKVKEDYEK